MEEMKLFFEDLRNQQAVSDIFRQMDEEFKEFIKEADSFIENQKSRL